MVLGLPLPTYHVFVILRCQLVLDFFLTVWILQGIGFDECVAILGEMVKKAKEDAGIDPSIPLEALVWGSPSLCCIPLHAMPLF